MTKRMFSEVDLVRLMYDGPIPPEEMASAVAADKRFAADEEAARKFEARIDFITPTGGY